MLEQCLFFCFQAICKFQESLLLKKILVLKDKMLIINFIKAQNAVIRLKFNFKKTIFMKALKTLVLSGVFFLIGTATKRWKFKIENIPLIVSETFELVF
jgi:hypothetical protein